MRPMPRLAFLAVLAALAFPAAARADDAPMPEVWRLRLATLGPLCGVRQEDWAGRFRIAAVSRLEYHLPQRKLSGLSGTAPEAGPYAALQAAAIMAEEAVRRAHALAGAGICSALATPDQFDGARADILFGPERMAFDPGSVGLHTKLLNQAWNLTIAAAAQACGQRGRQWLDTASEALEISFVEIPPDPKPYTPPRAVLRGLADMAVHAGSRIGATGKGATCAKIAATPELRAVDLAVREWPGRKRDLLRSIKPIPE